MTTKRRFSDGDTAALIARCDTPHEPAFIDSSSLHLYPPGTNTCRLGGCEMSLHYWGLSNFFFVKGKRAAASRKKLLGGGKIFLRAGSKFCLAEQKKVKKWKNLYSQRGLSRFGKRQLLKVLTAYG